MKVEQIYSLMNTVTEEILGESAVVAEDLSNVVDIGTAIFNATDVDNYVKKLVDRIARVIFVNRPYSGGAPSVYMTAFEFGSVMQKIQADMPLSSENEAWALEPGSSVDNQVFYQPSVSVKFFNKKVTFEVDMSFTELQVKESFTSAEQLNGFLSMLYNSVDKAMTVRVDGLIMRTINFAIANTVKDDYADLTVLGASSGVKAINLLKLYNDRYNSGVGDTPLLAEDALTTPEFIRFASYQMGLVANRMSRITTLFNVDGKERFTPSDLLHVVLLNDFAMGADAYLQSDTFHNEFTALPKAEVVPYWQGSGTSYAFDDISKIYAKIDDSTTVTVPGVLGVMFDRDALGVTNMDRRVTTHYNAKGEFYNNFYKFDCGAFYDSSEQVVVFFVADAA